ncbi:MAG: hypothetical protein ACOC0V_00285 [Oceanicaulis sp.]
MPDTLDACKERLRASGVNVSVLSEETLKSLCDAFRSPAPDAPSIAPGPEFADLAARLQSLDDLIEAHKTDPAKLARIAAAVKDLVARFA